MFGEKAAALRERHGVREYAIDIADRSAGDGNQVVSDAKERFANDFDVMLEQEVEMLEDRARETVFDWNDGGIDCFLDQLFEDIG